jgi:hypothetical protein
MILLVQGAKLGLFFLAFTEGIYGFQKVRFEATYTLVPVFKFNGRFQ